VKELAEYKCNNCGEGGYLESHHLESYAKNEELRYDVMNGVCLCRDCHYKFHQDYGYKNSTKSQYIEFKGVQNG
jgi:predicted HNH restriction endonuclease